MIRSYQFRILSPSLGVPCIPSVVRVLRLLILGGVAFLSAQSLSVVATASVSASASALRLSNSVFSIKTAFAAAWQRQPEAQSFGAFQAAAQQRQSAAHSFTAAPATLGLSAKSDQINQNQGSREVEFGATVPLWWPGERARAGSLAQAEAVAVGARLQAAQLRTAGVVREAVWAWQRAQLDAALVQDRLRSAQALAADVAKRVAAGDLARADQHEADGNVAAAQGSVIDSKAALLAAVLQLRVLTGATPSSEHLSESEVTPKVDSSASAILSHAEVADYMARAEIAKRNTDLVKVQQDANPELSIVTSRDRAGFAEPYRQSLSIGLRVPFGSGARQRAKAAAATAEFLELEMQANAIRDRVAASIDIANQRLALMVLQQDNANKRAQLAKESRGFVDKALRAGEIDLPKRLAAEREVSDAASSAARAQIDVSAAVSALRQAMGLLPN